MPAAGPFDPDDRAAPAAGVPPVRFVTGGGPAGRRSNLYGYAALRPAETAVVVLEPIP